jgi:hypothetical protein
MWMLEEAVSRRIASTPARVTLEQQVRSSDVSPVSAHRPHALVRDEAFAAAVFHLHAHHRGKRRTSSHMPSSVVFEDTVSHITSASWLSLHPAHQAHVFGAFDPPASGVSSPETSSFSSTIRNSSFGSSAHITASPD